MIYMGRRGIMEWWGKTKFSNTLKKNKIYENATKDL